MWFKKLLTYYFKIFLRSNLNISTFYVQQTSDFFLLKLVFFSFFYCFDSAMINLPFLILIFHDFPWSTIKFHDLQGLENEILKFCGFPGFPWPYKPCNIKLPHLSFWWQLEHLTVNVKFFVFNFNSANCNLLF